MGDDPGADHGADECRCGHLRDEHESGTGRCQRCTAAPGQPGRLQGCRTEFRLAFISAGERARLGIRPTTRGQQDGPRTG